MLLFGSFPKLEVLLFLFPLFSFELKKGQLMKLGPIRISDWHSACLTFRQTSRLRRDGFAHSSDIQPRRIFSTCENFGWERGGPWQEVEEGEGREVAWSGPPHPSPLSLPGRGEELIVSKSNLDAAQLGKKCSSVALFSWREKICKKYQLLQL